VSRHGPKGNVRVLERLLSAIGLEDPACFVDRCAAVESWPALLRLAEHHGVLAVLERAVRRSQYEPPAEAGLVLRRRAAVQRLVQSNLVAVSDEVLAALDRAGIPAVALKGPVLGERIHGDPALRVAFDLDVMVAFDQVPASLAALGSLGYQAAAADVSVLGASSGHHIVLRRDDSPPVELHYRLSSNFGVSIPSEGPLARSLAYRTRAGVVCRVLAPEDELVYLATHAAAHLFARLAWLLDVKLLLDLQPAPDWRVAWARAEEQQVGRAFAFAITRIASRMDICPLAGSLPPRFHRPRPGAAALLAASDRSSSSLSSTFFGRCFRTALCDSPIIAAADLPRRTAGVVRRRLGLD
jgi:hypothetical protein